MATRAPGSGQRRCNPAAEGGKHCGHAPNGANREINPPVKMWRFRQALTAGQSEYSLWARQEVLLRLRLCRAIKNLRRP